MDVYDPKKRFAKFEISLIFATGTRKNNKK